MGVPPPPQMCSFSRSVTTEDKRRARRPASKFADPIFLKKKTHVPYPPSPSPPSTPSVSMNAVKRKLGFLCSCGVLNFPLHAQPLTTTEKFKPTLLTHSPLLAKFKKGKKLFVAPPPSFFFDSCRDLACAWTRSVIGSNPRGRKDAGVKGGGHKNGLLWLEATTDTDLWRR